LGTTGPALRGELGPELGAELRRWDWNQSPARSSTRPWSSTRSGTRSSRGGTPLEPRTGSHLGETQDSWAALGETGWAGRHLRPRRSTGRTRRDLGTPPDTRSSWEKYWVPDSGRRAPLGDELGLLLGEPLRLTLGDATGNWATHWARRSGMGPALGEALGTALGEALTRRLGASLGACLACRQRLGRSWEAAGHWATTEPRRFTGRGLELLRLRPRAGRSWRQLGPHWARS
jgi:hypothetical protein